MAVAALHVRRLRPNAHSCPLHDRPRRGDAILPSCIESVRGVVDEIVIADTGSTDNTIAIARNLGARVISIPVGKRFCARAKSFPCRSDRRLGAIHGRGRAPRSRRGAPLAALLANRKAQGISSPHSQLRFKPERANLGPPGRAQSIRRFRRPRNIPPMSIMKTCACFATFPSCILWGAFTRRWASASSKPAAGWGSPTF